MSSHSCKAPSLASWWIGLCALCSVAGWVLSAVHQLNAAGYTLTFLLALGAVALWSRRTGQPVFCCRPLRRLRRRFSRPLPFSFLILAGLAFAGGALYAPNNWDALAYRVPRTLHWLAEGRWHWIPSIFQRLNLRGCGFEWTMAPLIALTRSDRLFFLINFISFCLFPGLVFTSLHRMGISRRVAYSWMWILPAGYCFLLQAASLGNDFFAAFFAIAAFAYGLRARQGAAAGEPTASAALWLSMLAAALTTGVKANNLPLLLLWVVVVAPCWRLLRQRWLVALGAGAVSLAISFFPTALLNQFYTGDWTGIQADEKPSVLQMKVSGARILGNVGVLLVSNLAPPVAPFAKAWNRTIAPKLLPQRVEELFEETHRSVIRFHPPFGMEELAAEESAGMGLGVCSLLLLSTVAALWIRWRHGKDCAEPEPPGAPHPFHGGRKLRLDPARHLPGLWVWLRGLSPAQLWIFGAVAVSTASFLVLSLLTDAEARLMNAYYPFLAIPLLALPGQAQVVRRCWWRVTALAAAVVAALPLALSPARPLIPASFIVDRLQVQGQASPLVTRAARVYSAYGRRAEALAPVLRCLPAQEKVIGFVGFDDPETSLWKPFGTRRVLHVCATDTVEQLRARGIRYVVANQREFPSRMKAAFPDWCARLEVEAVRTFSLNLRASEEPMIWHLVKLR